MVTKPTIWPKGRFGVPQITPYTYRDGQSLLELIKALRDHVVEQLHPNLQKAIDQLVADVETEYEKSHDRYVDGVQEFQRIHDAFMADVNARLIALNDGAVTDLVKDPTSLLGKILREVFTDRESFTTLETGITTLVSSFISDANTNFVHDRSPYFYGAVGDGVSDDSDALQAWLDSGSRNFASGTYLVSRTLEVERDDVHVVGSGKVTVLLSGSDHRFLTIRGDRAHVGNFTIDGQHRATGGVYVYGEDATVTHLTVHDCVNPVTARAIHVEGPGGSLIQNNVIRNMRAHGDGNLGDGNGMARAIVVYNPGPATKPTIVANNLMVGIWGEEGDAITVLHTVAGSNHYVDGKTTVENNVFDGASRRFIKVQSANCTVQGNTIDDSHNVSIVNPASCINFINSPGATVMNNTVYNKRLTAGIFLNSTTPAHGATVANNTVVSMDSSNAIYSSGYDNAKFTGNTLEIGRGRAISTSGNNIVMTGNVANGTTRTESGSPRTFVITGSGTRGVMANNVDNTTIRRYYSFDNGSSDGITQNNIGRW